MTKPLDDWVDEDAKQLGRDVLNTLTEFVPDDSVEDAYRAIMISVRQWAEGKLAEVEKVIERRRFLVDAAVEITNRGAELNRLISAQRDEYALEQQDLRRRLARALRSQWASEVWFVDQVRSAGGPVDKIYPRTLEEERAELRARRKK